MSAVNRETIENLINHTGETNISVFIPTHKKGEEGKQDPIRLKNVLQQVEKSLKEKDWKPEDIEELFEPTKKLIEENQFWLHQEHGLALYMSEDYFDYFKIPVSPGEDFYISDNFMVTPMLELQNHHGTYHILALSQGGTRVLKVSPDEIKEVPIESVPTTMEEHLKFHVHERSVQQHTGTTRNKAMFHGQGGDRNEDDKEVELFLRHIENKVTKYLKKVGGPLVLAGPEKMIAYYKEANNYHQLMDDNIKGNPDEKSSTELENVAWDIVEDYYREDMESDIERFHNLTNTALISSDVADIVKGAYYGKVDTLFVPKGIKKWGVFKEDEHKVHFTDNSNGVAVDLLNFATVHAIKNGATLYGLEPNEMPGDGELSAIYRYET